MAERESAASCSPLSARCPLVPVRRTFPQTYPLYTSAPVRAISALGTWIRRWRGKMREINRLTDAEVRSAKPDKGKFVVRLADGAGLYLQATRSGSGVNRNWIFRYELDGERHDLGIGPLHTVTLSE